MERVEAIVVQDDTLFGEANGGAIAGPAIPVGGVCHSVFRHERHRGNHAIAFMRQ